MTNLIIVSNSTLNSTNKGGQGFSALGLQKHGLHV